MDILDDYLPMCGAGREELITLYAWSFEDAKKAQDEYEKTDPEGARGPFFRWVDARDLILLADQFKRTGDNKILLQAIAICALNDFAIPQWCSGPYLKAFRDVWHYRAKSWDDSFGRPNPKGAQVGAKRQRREKSLGVHNRIREIKQKDPETPLDRELFDKVGKEFRICGSLADEYYYSVKKCHVAFRESATGEIFDKLMEPFKWSALEAEEKYNSDEEE